MVNYSQRTNIYSLLSSWYLWARPHFNRCTLFPAAMEGQGYGPDGDQGGESQAVLGHHQRGRYIPEDHQQIPMCDPIGRRLRSVQLCRTNCERWGLPWVTKPTNYELSDVERQALNMCCGWWWFVVVNSSMAWVSFKICMNIVISHFKDDVLQQSFYKRNYLKLSVLKKQKQLCKFEQACWI